METRRVLRMTGGGVVLLVLLAAGGCRSTNGGAASEGAAVAGPTVADSDFAVGVVPTMAPPVPVGSVLGFRLSSNRTGYGHLYLLTVDGGVTMLAENLPLAAGVQVIYPPAGAEFAIRATPPVGEDRAMLLVTLQPFVGFANNQGLTLSRPVTLGLTGGAFLEEFAAATSSLPVGAWASAETSVQVVE